MQQVSSSVSVLSVLLILILVHAFAVGGECGVPTARRFHMPRTAPTHNPPFWYSFNYGSMHVTVISTEHDLTSGSRQYKWLEQDLQDVDRYIMLV